MSDIRDTGERIAVPCCECGDDVHVTRVAGLPDRRLMRFWCQACAIVHEAESITAGERGER